MENPDSPVPLLMSFDNDDCCSTKSSNSSNEQNYFMDVEVNPPLYAADPTGVAATAAISALPRPKRAPFENDPRIRKRKTNRLRKKLVQMLDEIILVSGQQATFMLEASGSEDANSLDVFGSEPLTHHAKMVAPALMKNVQDDLSKNVSYSVVEDPNLFKLPPIVCDGKPVPVEKMTQAQLRTFIPNMLKFSTGRRRPGWGKEATKPPWWPENCPWANVRCDIRSLAQKQSLPWSDCLRSIVEKCYIYHGRKDLLEDLADKEEDNAATANGHNTAQFTSPVLDTLPDSHDEDVVLMQANPNNNSILTVPAGITVNIQEDAINLTLEQGTAVFDFHAVAKATLNATGEIVLTREDGAVLGAFVGFLPNSDLSSNLQK